MGRLSGCDMNDEQKNSPSRGSKAIMFSKRFKVDDKLWGNTHIRMFLTSRVASQSV